MDGRVQLPVNEWVRKKFGVDFVDTITEPGPNKILAENQDVSRINAIKERVCISVKKHHSNNIVIVGHYDCAGNPVDKDTQLSQIRLAVKAVSYWGFGINTSMLCLEFGHAAYHLAGSSNNVSLIIYPGLIKAAFKK